jgi:hypothetical protein
LNEVPHDSIYEKKEEKGEMKNLDFTLLNFRVEGSN